jgi:hypothetical protein
MDKLKNTLLLFTGYGLLFYCDKLDEFYFNLSKDFQKTRTNAEYEKNFNYMTSRKIFKIMKAEKYILNDQLKNKLNVSTPFNRKIKYIYDLPFYYVEYENYNFNKLSDLFLNIHIFIN